MKKNYIALAIVAFLCLHFMATEYEVPDPWDTLGGA